VHFNSKQNSFVVTKISSRPNSGIDTTIKINVEGQMVYLTIINTKEVTQKLNGTMLNKSLN